MVGLNIIYNLIIIIALFYTTCLACRNEFLGKSRTKCYLLVSTLIMILIVCDSVRAMTYNNQFSQSRIIHNAICVIIYSLEPIASFCFVYGMLKSKWIRNLSKTLIVINAVLCILSYYFGIVFDFSENSGLVKGKMYYFPVFLLATFYLMYVFLFFTNFKYDKRDNKLFIAIALFPICAMLIQIYNYKYIVAWSITAIAMILYYLALREMTYRYDSLTNIKNRAAFDQKMKRLNSSDKATGLIMLDLNNLKKINDRYGHSSGDKAIATAAQIFVESFVGIGTPFRIGGDEYCIICEDVDISDVKLALSAVNQRIAIVNQQSDFTFSAAYGFSTYNKNGKGEKTIYDTLKEADIKMYENKKINEKKEQLI